jgi:hypothetical protein
VLPAVSVLLAELLVVFVFTVPVPRQVPVFSIRHVLRTDIVNTPVLDLYYLTATHGTPTVPITLVVTMPLRLWI